MIAGQSVAILRTGPAGTITESRAVLARAPWANAVRVTLADDVTGWAATPAGDEPRRVHTVTRASTPGSTTTAQRSAAAILRRMLSRGRSARVTAPALYWVRPGHTVTIELPTGGQRRYIVSRARFTHPGDRMTLDVRTPADAPITTGE